MIYQLLNASFYFPPFYSFRRMPLYAKKMPVLFCKIGAKWRTTRKKGRESLLYEAYPAILADLTWDRD
jgi:hypothetical protein